MASNVYELGSQFRASLLARERAAAMQMVDAYAQVWTRLKVSTETLTAQMAAEKAMGREVNLDWLNREQRLAKLTAQTESELRRLVPLIDGSITEEQRKAVAAARDESGKLVQAALGDPPPGAFVQLNQLPADQLTHLVGHLADGSPLKSLLNELPGEGGEAVRRALIQGVGTGMGPREIAGLMRSALGENMARALNISRTEVLRSYREASRSQYRANDHVVKGWMWWCALTSRSCASCIAMHGTRHSLDERLDDHPSGRCAMLPETKTWAELGFSGVQDRTTPVETGSAWFAKQDLDTQRAILGPGKLQAYQAGKLTLENLVGRKAHPRWGTMRYERSLKDALADARSVYKPAHFTSQADFEDLIQQAKNDERFLAGYLDEKSEDAFMKQVLARQGFDGKAELLSKAELDRYVAAGEREMFRGVTQYQFVEPFRTGELYAGRGVYGSGTYTAYGEKGFQTAKGFASQHEKNMLRMTLRPDARVIKYEDLTAQRDKAFDEISAARRAVKTEQKETEALWDRVGPSSVDEVFEKQAEWKNKLDALNLQERVIAEDGRYAAMMGYDAIDIPRPKFMVILNRTAVRVQKEDLA